MTKPLTWHVISFWEIYFMWPTLLLDSLRTSMNVILWNSRSHGCNSLLNTSHTTIASNKREHFERSRCLMRSNSFDLELRCGCFHFTQLNRSRNMGIICRSVFVYFITWMFYLILKKFWYSNVEIFLVFYFIYPE